MTQDRNFSAAQPIDAALQQAPAKDAPTQVVISNVPRTRLIDGDDDVAVVTSWLRQYRNRPNTFSAYRKEADRLLLWLGQIAGKTLRDMRLDDWAAYEDFLADPPASWQGHPKPRSDPDWRPFRGPLSPNSVRYALTVLSDLVAFLVTGGYLEANPLALQRRGHQSRDKGVERYLPPAAWPAIVEYLESMPCKTATQIAASERALFVITWAEATGGRASELAAARMADVRRDDRGDTGQWWWHLLGKGKKDGRVPLTDDAIAALMRYRTFLGLTALPSIHEGDVALIWQTRGRDRSSGVTRSTLHRLTKDAFTGAARDVAVTDPDTAARLAAASTHWLRHSTATNAIDNDMDLRDVQQLMRHSSINTTTQYVHDQAEERHKRAQRPSALNR